jgi:uncharacterized protein YjbI with pentapeptide repeats
MSKATSKKPLYLDELSIVDEAINDGWSENVLDFAVGVDDYEDPEQMELMMEEKDDSSQQKLDLEGVNYNYAVLRNWQMSFINILSSELSYANLELANLVGSNIQSSSFHGANLRYADLEYAEINKSDFNTADLTGANLMGCNLKDCDFSYADLRGANLAECVVKKTKMQDAIYDGQTILPFDKAQARKLGMVYIPQLMHKAS